MNSHQLIQQQENKMNQKQNNDRLGNHRGSSSLLVLIFEIIGVLVVMGILFTATIAYASSGGIKNIHVNNELYLLVNAIVAVPGDVTLQLSQGVFSDLSSYRVEFQGSGETAKITTIFFQEEENKENEENEEKEKKNNPEEKPQVSAHKLLILPRSYTLTGTVERERVVCLEKKGQQIDIKPCSKVQK